MLFRFIFAFITHVHATSGYLNFKFSGVGKSFFQDSRNSSTGKTDWPFIAPPSLSSLEASFGSLSSRVDLPTQMPDYTLHTAASFQWFKGCLVSAHLVMKRVHPGQTARVLFHVNRTEGWLRYQNSSTHGGQELKTFCLYAHAKQDTSQKTYTSYCQLNLQTTAVCLAQVLLEENWWPNATGGFPPLSSSHIDILFSMENSTCHKKFFRSPPPTARTFVDSVELVPDLSTYQELKEDQHILIYSPQGMYFAGSRFKVPVKLQADSKLVSFDIKLKTRPGIFLEKIISSNDILQFWHFKQENGTKPSSWIIGAKARSNNTQRHKVQELFTLIFEISDNFTSGTDWVRLMFTLEYENHHGNLKLGKIENKATAKIQINTDKIQAIVPVIKMREMVNTALLDGTALVYPLQIFSVSHSGLVQDVTSLSTCHSSDEAVALVSESCRSVELTNRSTKGSSGVDVIAKFGRYTSMVKVKVWVPSFPVTIELSDSRLGQISGWNVANGNGKEGDKNDSGGNLTGKSSSPDDPGAAPCRSKYQSSFVEVYSEFVTSKEAGDLQSGSKFKAPFRVTHLFAPDRLTIKDPPVGRLLPGPGGTVILEGLKPGRSEVQVWSTDGKIAKEAQFMVGSDKVFVTRIDAEVITDLRMKILDDSSDLGRLETMVVSVSPSSEFDSRNRVGLINAHLVFSDGTRFPVHALDHGSFNLNMSVGNDNHSNGAADRHSHREGLQLHHVVEPTVEVHRPLSSSERTSFLYPKLVLAPPSANVKLFSRLSVSLKFTPTASAGRCPAAGQKSSGGSGQPRHVLAEGEAQFSLDESIFEDIKSARLNQSFSFSHYSSGIYDGSPKKKSRPDQSDPSLKNQEAHVVVSKQQNDESSHHSDHHYHHFIRSITPLETAMFVAVVIFCVVVAVLLVHWVVGAARKRRPLKVKDSGSGGVCGVENDWVWIGHKTLEKNSVQTTCLATLMPEEDFNSSVGVGAAGGGGISNGGVMHPETPPPLPPREWKSGDQNRKGNGATTGDGSHRGRTKKQQLLLQQRLEKKKNSVAATSSGNFRLPVPPRPSRAPRLSSMPSANLASKIGEAYLIDNPAKVNPAPCSEIVQSTAAGPGSLASSGSYIGGSAYPGDTLAAESGAAASHLTSQQQAEVWLKKSLTNDMTASRKALRIRKLEEAAAASGSDVDFDCASMEEDQFVKYLESLKESSA